MALVAATPGLPRHGPESGAEDQSRVRPRKPAVGAQFVRSKVRVPRAASMSRERLESLADETRRHRLTLVVAPAGSGKTTLMSRWAGAAEAAGTRVGWYRAESTDATAPTFLGYLQLAIGEALRPSGERDVSPHAGARPWQTVEEAAAWLEGSRVEGLLLVIDDFHALVGSEAETALARFIDLSGPNVCIVVGTRSLPSFDLSRLRLSGDLLEITGDDLRFRSWEVERLFREYYGEVLRGDELGRLARRTEGWAAGLQFFHLATRDKSPAERTRLLQALGGSTRLIREYLARNVLDELPDELRAFLVDTSPLRRLSGPLCDVYLDRRGSAALLEELERRQVFTVSLDDGTYRYHEVLQAHLEQVLTETRGETAARAGSARAGELLEERGFAAEALAAYCRADRWEDAARVLGTGGEWLKSDSSADWLAEVAPAVIRNDPWLRLGSARRLRAEGHWARALGAFAEAEAAFGAAEMAASCRAERQSLAAFFDPTARPPLDWTGTLRAALRRDPLGRRTTESTQPGRPAADSAPDRLAIGLATLAAGYVADARTRLLGVALDPDADPAIAAAATIGAGTAGALAGDPTARADLERGAAMAERTGQGWLARLGRAALSLAGPSSDEQLAELRTLREEAAREGDAWGEVLEALAEGWVLIRRRETALRPLELAAAGARRLNSGTLEAWARGLGALAAARAGLPEAHETALHAESQARVTGVVGASIPIYMAMAASDPGRSAEHRALAETIIRETGIANVWDKFGGATSSGDTSHAGANGRFGVHGRLVEDVAQGCDGQPSDAVAPISVRLLGGFAMEIAGRPVNLAAIKPRPRAVLRLLALNAGRPVHREVLAATFWPDADPTTAARNVHVALSGLRKELCNETGCDTLVREGDAYRLVIPPGGRVDLQEAEKALSLARAAHGRKDAAAAAAAYRCAIELARGELLPEDGPADWVVYRRDETRIELSGAARALAEMILDTDPNGAAEACAAGLRLDPHHDGLWRLLIAAREKAGDLAAAATARQGYERMLVQMGLTAGYGELDSRPTVE